jgi:hypothetical protein
MENPESDEKLLTDPRGSDSLNQKGARSSLVTIMLVTDAQTNLVIPAI